MAVKRRGGWGGYYVRHRRIFVSAQGSRETSLRGHCHWGLRQHRRVSNSGSDVSSSQNDNSRFDSGVTTSAAAQMAARSRMRRVGPAKLVEFIGICRVMNLSGMPWKGRLFVDGF